MRNAAEVIYWDSSAVLSVLFKDNHSIEAQSLVESSALHLLTTLAYAEVTAVISRMKRERLLTESLSQSAHARLDRGPWQRISIPPGWSIIRGLASKHALRGADLWHLSAAVTLKGEFPELGLLTFDLRLMAAAKKAGFVLVA
jgi:predicted nucleic acid-binding protein